MTILRAFPGRTPLAVAAALVGLGALAVGLHRGRTEAPNPAQRQAELAAMGRLEQRLSALESRQRAPVVAPPPVRDRPPNDAPTELEEPEPKAPEEDMGQLKVAEGISGEERRLALDEEIERQPTDRAWSHQVETVLAEVFSSPALQSSRVLGLRCGSTLCRAEIEHEDAEAQGTFGDDLWKTPLRRRVSGVSGFELEATDRPKTLVYLAHTERK